MTSGLNLNTLDGLLLYLTAIFGFSSRPLAGARLLTYRDIRPHAGPTAASARALMIAAQRAWGDHLPHHPASAPSTRSISTLE
jgi:hypothetical protein